MYARICGDVSNIAIFRYLAHRTISDAIAKVKICLMRPVRMEAVDCLSIDCGFSWAVGPLGPTGGGRRPPLDGPLILRAAMCEIVRFCVYVNKCESSHLPDRA